MKIGIYTIIANNYGAQLQAYATAHYLQQICKGDIVELIYVPEVPNGHNWRRMVKSFLPQEVIRKRRFNQFQKLSPLTRSYTESEILNSPPQYDLHIVGSDQVWNLSKGFDNHIIYFLPFHTKSPKIALASSFGTSNIPTKFKEKASKYLKDFKSIAVRETEGVQILSELGISAEEILDPTFWINTNEWDKLAGEEPIIQGEYVFAFGFETSNQNPQKFINCIKELYGFPIVGLITFRHFQYDKRCETFGPPEFLNVIKFARLIITSSFHTIVFSLLFQKDFFLLKHSTRNSRMESLLRKVNLESRMIGGSPESYRTTIEEQTHIDYGKVNPLIKELQKTTRIYIRRVISKYL